MKVAWVSRHKPLPAQLNELKKKLGDDVEVIQISKTFRDVREVYYDIKSAGAQYAVVVLPLSMIAALAQYRDIVWIWAEMEAIHQNCKGEFCSEYNPDSDVILEAVGMTRHLRFKEFKQILKVEMVTESL